MSLNELTLPKQTTIPPERMQLFIELFRLVGYRSPSMLDIAQHINISKKTLYAYVNNKEELIIKALAVQHSAYSSEIESLTQRNLSAEKELTELSKLLNKFYQEFTEHAIHDLEHYYPRALQDYLIIEKLLQKTLYIHFKKHQTNKAYKDSENAEFLSVLIIHQIKQIVHKKITLERSSINSLLNRFIGFIKHALVRS